MNVTLYSNATDYFKVDIRPIMNKEILEIMIGQKNENGYFTHDKTIRMEMSIGQLMQLNSEIETQIQKYGGV